MQAHRAAAICTPVRQACRSLACACALLRPERREAPPTHLHKHLARSQAQQLVGGHPRVGAANPAGQQAGSGMRMCGAVSRQWRSAESGLHLPAPVPSTGPVEHERRRKTCAHVQRMRLIGTANMISLNGLNGQLPWPCPRCPHHSHSGVCWSFSLEKKPGSWSVCSRAQRLHSCARSSAGRSRGVSLGLVAAAIATTRGLAIPTSAFTARNVGLAPVASQYGLQGGLWSATGRALFPVAHGACC